MNHSIFIDSDFWIGLFVEKDAHHDSVIEWVKQLRDQDVSFITSNAVVSEVCTWMSSFVSQEEAVKFLRQVNDQNIQMLFIDKDVFQAATTLFQKQQKKHTSFVDVSNVALCQYWGIPKIASFDAFYKKFNLL